MFSKAPLPVVSRFSVFLMALLVLCLGQAHASITTVPYNTGVDASGTPLPDGTLVDPHYSLTVVPLGSTNVTEIRTSVGIPSFPIPPWAPDDGRSAWIGPANNQSLNGPFGIYDYQTTFNIGSAAEAASFLMRGLWATDNEGVTILVNGVATANNIPSTGDYASFAGFHSFTLASNFVQGVNTLDFIINNGYNTNPLDPQNQNPGPTGVRVEFTSQGVNPAVPEPTSLAVWALLAGGSAGLATARRRRRDSSPRWSRQNRDAILEVIAGRNRE
jgi:hypothetical protein